MTDGRSIPDGWRWVRFGDVARQVKATTRDPQGDGFSRIVGLEHLDSESLQLHRWHDLDDLPDGTSFTRIFRSGQVLFGKRRAYQRKVAAAGFDGVCSGDILVFETATDELLPDFLPYVVQSDSFFDQALGTSAGSLSPRTKWQDLAVFEFALPPLNEQRKIAEALRIPAAESDAVERSLGAVDTLSDALGAAAFSSLESTQWAPLEDIASIPPQNGVTVPKNQRTGPVQMMNMGALFREEVVVSGCSDTFVALTKSQVERFALQPGDLLFARRSIVLEGAGRCVMVSEVVPPVVFESSIIRVRVDPDVADPEFVLRYLHSPQGRAATSRIVRKGAVAGITGSDLRRLPVPLPPLERQIGAVEPWSELERVRAALKRKRQAGGKVGRALREALLNGRCDV